MLAAAFGKLISSMTSFIKPVALRLTRNLRATMHVEKELRAAGLQPYRRAVRRSISRHDVWKLAQRGDLSGLQVASEEIALQSGGSEQHVAMVESALTRGLTLSGTTAQALVIGQTASANQYDALSTQLTASNSDSILFSSRLSSFSPLWREPLEQLRQVYPRECELLVGRLERADSRAERLDALAADLPQWARDPSMAGLLGHLSEDAGARATAHKFYELAVEAGATPAVLWRLRSLQTAGLPDDQLENALRSLPEHPLVSAMLPGDPATRIAVLDEWNPAERSDKAWKLTLLAELHLRNRDLSSAANIGIEGHTRYSSGSAGLVAVRAKIARSLSDQRTLHPHDVSEALALAISIRDEWRQWGVRSGAAVALAMRAQSLLQNTDGAWKLSQLPPAGEARDFEAAFGEVRDMALQLQLEAGSIDAAEALLDGRTPEALRKQVRARRLELEERQAEANAIWEEAIDLTDDWGSRTSLLFRLALRGVRARQLTELAALEPAIAGEIELIADLFGDSPAAEAAVFEAAANNPLTAHAYLEFLASRGRLTEAGESALAAFNRWSDSDFALRAARYFRAAGTNQRAIGVLEQALLAAPQDWGGLQESYVLLVECAAEESLWDKAIAAAVRLVALRPESAEAQWAVIAARLHAGDEPGALAALNEFHTDPPGRQPLLVWLTLYRKYGAKVGAPSDVHRLTKPFWSDEEVRRIAVGSLMFAPAPEGAESLSDYPGNPIADYMADFPESKAFTAIEIDLSEGPQAILESIQDAAFPRSDEADFRKDLLQQIERGEMPYGALSLLTGKSFAESVIAHGSLPRFIGREQAEAETHIYEAFAAGRVAVDLTAIYSLARLPEPVAAALLSRPAQVLSSTEQLVDLNMARETFRRPDQGYFVPGNDGQLPTMTSPDASEREVLNRISARMVDLFQLTSRSTVNRQAPDEREAENSEDESLLSPTIRGVWTRAIELAAEQGALLWCDDLMTRGAANEVGIQAVGTDTLLVGLRNDDAVTADLLDSAEARLISDYAVGLPYRSDAWRLAYDFDSHRARGLACAVRHSSSRYLDEKVELVLSALGDNTDDPTEVALWAESGARLLVRLVVKDQLDSALSQYTLRVFGALSGVQDSLRFAFNGIRSASVESWATSLEDACRRLRRSIAEEADVSIASQYLLSLSRSLDIADREIVVAIALEP